MKKLVSLALILCLLCCALVGCGGRILTAEELMANIAEDPPADRTDVVAIFETWDMPSFYSGTFRPYLAAYEGRMQTHGVTPLMLARMAATDFVETEYDAINLSNRQEVTSALLRCYERAAETLCPPLTQAEDLRAAIDTGGQTHDYASMYLVAWGYPSFVTQKLMAVETLFDIYYYKDMKTPAEMAAAVANAFLDTAYGAVSLTDRTSVTDAYLTLYVDAIGDRYSKYRVPELAEQYEEDRNGEYVGIGITVQRDEQTDELHIVALNPEGPAKAAGIEVGDLLYAVDGVLVSELGYNAAISAVRGEVGTTVTVTVLRDGALIDCTIERVSLVDITVTYSIEDGIGYIQITEFKTNTAEQFRAAIDAMEQAGVRGVIYDLRDNPGGALSSVTDAIGYLVPKGTRIASFSTYMDPVDSETEHAFRVPSVVLCNENTASAGELFTAALRDFSTDAFDLQDATIVGVPTYGKGVMQSTFTMYDDSTVTVTVAQYNPPSGVNYDGEGIVPDVIVQQQAEGDAQLSRAYEILRTQIPNE